MGFRTDSYATVWSVEQVSDTKTKGRITISRKNRQTGRIKIHTFGRNISHGIINRKGER